MKKSAKTIMLLLLCFAVLLGIAVFVFRHQNIEFKLPEDVDRIDVQYVGETFQLSEIDSTQVCKELNELEFIKTSKASQVEHSGGIVLTLYKNGEVVKNVYVTDMNTIQMDTESGMRKFLTETDLVEYFNKVLEKYMN